MTDGSNQQANNEAVQEKTSKKRQSFLTKFVILLSLIVFGYFGAKYYQIRKANRLAAQSQVEKYDNLESEIFDLSDEYKTQANDPNLPDLTVNELKEKGAEFIYQMLLKNQVQINDLREEMQKLRGELTRYKNNEKIGSMIFNYVELRQEVYAGQPYSEALKNFELLAAGDENLQGKVARLKLLLPDFTSHADLVETFDSLIPELIAAKTNNPNAGIIEKMRHNLSKLVVVRKIDGKNSQDVDGAIAKTEKLLHEQNYQEALNSLLVLDQKFHPVLADFLSRLSVASELQKTDNEIFNYLKSLS